MNLPNPPLTIRLTQLNLLGGKVQGKTSQVFFKKIIIKEGRKRMKNYIKQILKLKNSNFIRFYGWEKERGDCWREDDALMK